MDNARDAESPVGQDEIWADGIDARRFLVAAFEHEQRVFAQAYPRAEYAKTHAVIGPQKGNRHPQIGQARGVAHAERPAAARRGVFGHGHPRGVRVQVGVDFPSVRQRARRPRFEIVAVREAFGRRGQRRRRVRDRTGTGHPFGRPVQARIADVDRREPELGDGGRRRIQREVVMFGVIEERIRDAAVHVLARGLPLRERARGKHKLAAGRVPVAVVVKEVFQVLPTAGHKDIIVEVDDIAQEIKRLVGLRLEARAKYLCFLRPGENVVLDQVIAAIVQVERAVARAVNDVVADSDVRTALVQVNAPAAVAAVVHRHVVTVVVVHERARRLPDQVDQPHVAQNALLSDVMDMILLDEVVVGRTGPVPDRPADGDTRVAVIGHVVVRHLVIGGSANTNAHRAQERLAAVVDPVIVDDVAARADDVVAAHVDGAGPEIIKVIAPDRVVRARSEQEHAVGRQMREFAVFDDAVAHLRAFERTGQFRERQRFAQPVVRGAQRVRPKRVVRVLK